MENKHRALHVMFWSEQWGTEDIPWYIPMASRNSKTNPSTPWQRASLGAFEISEQVSFSILMEGI